MLADDEYRTIKHPSQGLFTDRGSKFYAFAYPVTSEHDVKTRLAALRDAHPRAGHHCYAFRLGPGHYRAADDGEPPGSAGRPILNTLYSRQLTHVLVAVVRYFGGRLLGVPGLIQAYKTATEHALDEACGVVRHVSDTFELTFAYEATASVNRLIKAYDLELAEQTFGAHCKALLLIRQTRTNQVLPLFEEIEGVTLTLRPVEEA